MCHFHIYILCFKQYFNIYIFSFIFFWASSSHVLTLRAASCSRDPAILLSVMVSLGVKSIQYIMASFMQCAHPLESGVTPHRGKCDFLSEFIVQKVAVFFSWVKWDIIANYSKSSYQKHIYYLKNRLMQMTCLIKSHVFVLHQMCFDGFTFLHSSKAGHVLGSLGAP